jgi:xanthine/uracil permease
MYTNHAGKSERSGAFIRSFGTICLVKRVRRKIVWLIAVAMGLCGGWLAAGALNDHRIDIPRIVSPTSQPSPSAPAPGTK